MNLVMPKAATSAEIWLDTLTSGNICQSVEHLSQTCASQLCDQKMFLMNFVMLKAATSAEILFHTVTAGNVDQSVEHLSQAWTSQQCDQNHSNISDEFFITPKHVT
jgi:muramidase (phage lysozyme)